MIEKYHDFCPPLRDPEGHNFAKIPQTCWQGNFAPIEQWLKLYIRHKQKHFWSKTSGKYWSEEANHLIAHPSHMHFTWLNAIYHNLVPEMRKGWSKLQQNIGEAYFQQKDREISQLCDQKTLCYHWQ